ncbi:MAG: cyclic nucleotide-binding domain-containing protein [Acidimicrobiia bacterium]
MPTGLDAKSALKEVDLFASLEDELLSAVADSSTVSHFEAGQELISQGAPADGAWIILEGEVKLLRNSEVVAEYGPGKMVGDLSLLSGSPHSVDAVAITNGKRLNLGIGEFRAAVRNHPDVAFALIEVLVERIYHMQSAADSRG